MAFFSGAGPAPKLAFGGLNVLVCLLSAHPQHTHPLRRRPSASSTKGAARPPLWNPFWVGVQGLGRQLAHQNIESGKSKLWGWTSAAEKNNEVQGVNKLSH